MSARIDPRAETPAGALDNAALLQLAAPFAAPLEATAETDERWGNGPSLPSDHAAWMRDSLSVSHRARARCSRASRPS